MRSIYFYQQSFFRSDSAEKGIFADLHFTDSPPDSDSFCIDTLWKNRRNEVVKEYQEIDGQNSCNVGVLSEDDGLPFKQYLWKVN